MLARGGPYERGATWFKVSSPPEGFQETLRWVACHWKSLALNLWNEQVNSSTTKYHPRHAKSPLETKVRYGKVPKFEKWWADLQWDFIVNNWKNALILRS